MKHRRQTVNRFDWIKLTVEAAWLAVCALATWLAVTFGQGAWFLLPVVAWIPMWKAQERWKR